MTIYNPSDETLIQRIAEGDHEAFAEPYDRFGKPSYSLAYRITGGASDAEDAVQDAFLGIWSMARSFDVRRWQAQS